MTESLDPHVFVVIGTGDLTTRKLLPSLYRLERQGLLGDGSAILCAGRRTDLDDERYRTLAMEALDASGIRTDEAARSLRRRLGYHSIRSGSVDDYRELGARIGALEAKHDLPGNRVFYLAIPPGAFGDALRGLGEAGLAESAGWTRVVIEKPFGRDLASARRLNETAHRYFDESQLFRIDHYLGKETVQNLLFLRFSNTVIESLWNRDRIDDIQVTVSETLGIEGRAGYYEKAGALRDMVQNHLTQLVSLVGMEAPNRFDASAVRAEKLKLVESVSTIRSTDVVFGQYAAGHVRGEPVIAYGREPGVARGSATETFVAMKLRIENWRWQGIPIYLRTGKRLAERMTRIVVTFKTPPVCPFSALGGDCPSPNRLVVTLQPDAGFALHLDVRAPNDSRHLESIPLRFRYEDAFERVPDAYDTLLVDLLAGDQTHFVGADETEASWALYTPLLEDRPVIRPYAAGSWGPAEADALLARDGREWWHPAPPRAEQDRADATVPDQPISV